MAVGRKRSAVSMALRPRTSWQKKFIICKKPLSAPHIRKTLMQTLAKILLLHNEFGISAGLPRRSWRPTHRTNANMSVTERIDRQMLVGDLMFELSAVTILSLHQQGYLIDDGRVNCCTPAYKTTTQVKYLQLLLRPSQYRRPAYATI